MLLNGSQRVAVMSLTGWVPRLIHAQGPVRSAGYVTHARPSAWHATLLRCIRRLH
jgi:hypothetical protein